MRNIAINFTCFVLAGVILLLISGCTPWKQVDDTPTPYPYPTVPSKNAINPTVPASLLQLAPNGRYLVDQNNQPVFWSGDAAWSIIAQLSNADADYYLSARQQKGVNVIIVNLIEHKFATNAPKDINGNPPFTSTPFSTPNETYFAHADTIINNAAQKGMTVLLAPLYLGYNCTDEGWCAEVQNASISDLQSWGTYVGNRYKNYNNIIWVIGGDVDPTLYNLQTKVTAFVTSLQQADGRHLITAHNARGEMAVSPWSGANWLTLNNIYSANETTYQLGQSAYNLSPAKPFFQIEGYYENEHSMTVQQLRAQAYWTVLSGGMGYIFGNCPIWGFGPPAGSFCPGTNSDWKAALSMPGITQMSYVQALFSGVAWQNLAPDWGHTAMTSGYGTYGGADYATAELSSDGSLFVAYLPTRRTVTINMAKFSGLVIASWYDPTRGSFSPVTGSPFANSGSQQFTPTSNNADNTGDWVLVLKAGPTIPITSPTDTGQTTVAGTFSYALYNSKSGDTIYFNLPNSGKTVTVTQGSLPSLKTGVNLLGSCNPKIAIVGTAGINGLVLGGNNNLIGLYIYGFSYPIIKILNNAGSKAVSFSCTKVGL